MFPVIKHILKYVPCPQDDNINILQCDQFAFDILDAGHCDRPGIGLKYLGREKNNFAHARFADRTNSRFNRFGVTINLNILSGLAGHNQANRLGARKSLCQEMLIRLVAGKDFRALCTQPF